MDAKPKSGVVPIEALADAIGKLNGMADPESDAYQLRNPGLLRAASIQSRRKQEANEGGLRRFSSMVAGYSCLVSELVERCSGRGERLDRRRGTINGNSFKQEYLGGRLVVHMNITEKSPLGDLLEIYGLGLARRQVVNFLRRALWNDCITEFTEVKFFVAGVTEQKESEAVHA